VLALGGSGLLLGWLRTEEEEEGGREEEWK